MEGEEGGGEDKGGEVSEFEREEDSFFSSFIPTFFFFLAPALLTRRSPMSLFTLSSHDLAAMLMFLMEAALIWPETRKLGLLTHLIPISTFTLQLSPPSAIAVVRTSIAKFLE